MESFAHLLPIHSRTPSRCVFLAFETNLHVFVCSFLCCFRRLYGKLLGTKLLLPYKLFLVGDYIFTKAGVKFIQENSYIPLFLKECFGCKLFKLKTTNTVYQAVHEASTSLNLFYLL